MGDQPPPPTPNELKSPVGGDGGEESLILIQQKDSFSLLINMEHTFHENKTLITYK